MSEPRIVESGPINIKVDMHQAVQLYLQNVLADLDEETLKEFVRQVIAARLSAQSEGDKQDG